jgi:predicted flap endonuclease-1-like 5' DNA nuclease
MLEVSINNLADAMNRLAYAIEGMNPQSATAVTQAAVLKAAVAVEPVAEQAVEPEAEPVAEPVAKKSPKKKAEAKPEPEVQPEAEPVQEKTKPSTVSKDQLRVIFGQLSKAKGGGAVKAILNDFGYEGFSTVPDDAEEIEAMFRTAQQQLA